MPPETVRGRQMRAVNYPVGEFRCELCRNCPIIFTRNSAAFQDHLGDVNHRYNYLMYAFKTRRNRIAQNRHGVEVKTTCDTQEVNEDPKDGTVKTVVFGEPDELQEVVFKFEVINSNNVPIKLCDVFLVHRYAAFSLLEAEGFQTTKQRIELLSDSSCVFNVRLESDTVGKNGVPVVFSFLVQKPGKADKHFHIIRMMVVNLVGREIIPHNNEENSPYKGEDWPDMRPVPGIQQNGKPLKHVRGFELKPVHREMFSNWLHFWPGMPDEASLNVNHIKTVAREGYKSLRDHYVPFFHTLLHLEEYESALTLQRFNMSAVHLEILKPGVFKLEVPGLPEKRPTVLKGDLIYVRVHYPDRILSRFPNGSVDNLQYEGRVSAVFEDHVRVSSFSPEFVHRFECQPYLVFDVRFALPRFPFVVMHRAVDLVAENNLLDVLFPSSNQHTLMLPSNNRLQPELIPSNFKFEFFNSNIPSNNEQELAVRNIVSGVCRPSPYIIFGPPGTGKTVTVVEAILQVKKLFRDSYILVCAPSNSACDVVTEKLAGHCKSSELLRMYSSSRDLKLVSNAIRNFSLLKENEFQIPNVGEIVKYRIVVCTLVTASRFASLLKGKSKNHFTHVFIDECGHALEPEAVAAFAGILGQVKKNGIGGQLILAGDPKQLGPVCVSKRAERILPRNERQGRDTYPTELAFLNSRVGLGVSLLERLMVSCDIYTKNEAGLYNPRYTTKLLLNYRSHPTILELPNHLFYDKELKTRCPDDVKNDPLLQLSLFRRKQKAQVQPVIFHGILDQERKEGRAPSFFNLLEITQVMVYLEKLLASGKVKQTEIGVISPYIRQVYKLKKELEKKKWNEVEVGTTEVFQGREKRVVIVSTVRGNKDLLDMDGKYQVGFLADEKRFNVAITRARSLLIVIGNTFLLGEDPNWLALMEYCRQLNSYVGCHYQIRNEEWMTQTMKNVTRMNENWD